MKGPNWSVVVTHCAISFLWRNIHCFYCRTLSPSKPAKVKTKFRIFAFFFAASAVFLGFCCAEFYHCGSRWKQNFHRSSLGGGLLKDFIRGGSAPRSDSLPSYIPFLAEKIPLSYTFHSQMVPLLYTSMKYHEWKALVDTYMTDFPTLSYTSTQEIPTLSYIWSTKKVPFSGGASPYRSL